MSYVEFCDWVAFYLEHPFDDEHRYHRPAALVAASMATGDMEARLEWLKGSRVGSDGEGQYSEADLKTFAAFGVKPPSASE